MRKREIIEERTNLSVSRIFQLYKCIKKGVKHKNQIRNGLKDVQSRIRKGERGLVVFAGDVTPIEVMCHLPAVCEEKGLPYCYTPSRQDLGSERNWGISSSTIGF